MPLTQEYPLPFPGEDVKFEPLGPTINVKVSKYLTDRIERALAHNDNKHPLELITAVALENWLNQFNQLENDGPEI